MLLNPGDEVYIVGRSNQRRGLLIAEYGGKQFLLPYQHTELRVSHYNYTGFVIKWKKKSNNYLSCDICHNNMQSLW